MKLKSFGHILIFSSLFIFGGIIRIASGKPLISTNMLYIKSSKVGSLDNTKPEDIALLFYMYIDKGEYDKAWDISIEPDWAAGRKPERQDEVVPVPGKNPQPISRERFVERLTEELGNGGVWLRLNDLKSEIVNKETDPALKKTIELLKPDNVQGVTVSGQVITGCAVFSWHKDLPVLKFGDKYKIVLPGTKRADALYYQSWLSNLKKCKEE
jgi:hypothetical protein